MVRSAIAPPVSPPRRTYKVDRQTRHRKKGAPAILRRPALSAGGSSTDPPRPERRCFARERPDFSDPSRQNPPRWPPAIELRVRARPSRRRDPAPVLPEARAAVCSSTLRERDRASALLAIRLA